MLSFTINRLNIRRLSVRKQIGLSNRRITDPLLNNFIVKLQL
jgi:hypothetical protein